MASSVRAPRKNRVVRTEAPLRAHASPRPEVACAGRRLWDLPASVVKHIVGIGCLEAGGRLATTSSTFRGLLDEPNPCFDRIQFAGNFAESRYSPARHARPIEIYHYDHARSPPPACVAPHYERTLPIDAVRGSFIDLPALRAREIACVSRRCRNILSLEVSCRAENASYAESALASLVSASPRLELIILGCSHGNLPQRFVWHCLAAPALQRIEIEHFDQPASSRRGIIKKNGQIISLTSCVATAPIASCPNLKTICDTNFVDDESIYTLAAAKCPRLSELRFDRPIFDQETIISSRPWLTLATFPRTAILAPGSALFNASSLPVVDYSRYNRYFHMHVMHNRYFDMRQLPIDLANHLPGPEVRGEALEHFTGD